MVALCLAVALAGGWSASGTLAAKPSPAVTGAWRPAPRAAMHRPVRLTLRVSAARASSGVRVAFYPTPGVEVVSPAGWSGPLERGQRVDLVVTVRVVRDGRWTLGASITDGSTEPPDVAGALLTIDAGRGRAAFSPGAPPQR